MFIIPIERIVLQNVSAVGSICGYGEVSDLTTSRSKNLAFGIRRSLKDAEPVRDCGSFGMNQEAHIGTVSGCDLEGDLGFDFRSSCSLDGVMIGGDLGLCS